MSQTDFALSLEFRRLPPLATGRKIGPSVIPAASSPAQLETIRRRKRHGSGCRPGATLSPPVLDHFQSTGAAVFRAPQKPKKPVTSDSAADLAWPVACVLRTPVAERRALHAPQTNSEV